MPPFANEYAAITKKELTFAEQKRDAYFGQIFSCHHLISLWFERLT